MLLAEVNLQEQSYHLTMIVVSILQPLLVLLVIVGIVIAFAHLLTMIGTRWGDRRASSKALFFSIGVHIVLGAGLIALIPEYRQQLIAKLVDTESEPIRIMTPQEHTHVTNSNTDSGQTQIWNQIPKTSVAAPSRFNAPMLMASANTPLPQQVTTEPVPQENTPDSTPLPEEARPTPEQEVMAEQGKLEQATVNMKVETLKTESRPDTTIPSSSRNRSARPVVGPEDDPNVPRPTVGGVEAISPESTPDRNRQQITDMVLPNAPLQKAPLANDVNRRQGPAPGELKTDLLGQQHATNNARSPGASPVDPQMSRTRPRPAFSRDESMSIGRYRPSVRPTAPDPVRTQGRNSITGNSQFFPSNIVRPQIERGTDNFLTRVDQSRIPSTYQLRGDANRERALLKYGGSTESEEAVDLSLKWLASTQNPRGYWDASDAGAGRVGIDEDGIDRKYAGREADTGITALAVLAFLGKQNTIDQGEYSAEVTKALRWLTQQQKNLDWRAWGSVGSSDGYLGGNASEYSGMYCHAMATFAIAEAYAMSRDNIEAQWLRPPLQKAVQFIINTQIDDGGWRYIKGQTYGDTSIFGWQLMALKSAEAAGIQVPFETKNRLINFLNNRRLGRQGGLAGYRYLRSKDNSDRDLIDPPSPAMTAEALFCRQMLGIANDSSANKEATTYLLDNRPRRTTMNLYYWYYGTLSMFQHGGKEWDQWNSSMRDLLVTEQRKSGPLAGSWDPRGAWGGYGGRVYSTSIATLSLEVYYRYLPLYRLNEE